MDERAESKKRDKGPRVQLWSMGLVDRSVCSARGVSLVSLKTPHCFRTLMQHHRISFNS